MSLRVGAIASEEWGRGIEAYKAFWSTVIVIGSVVEAIIS